MNFLKNLIGGQIVKGYTISGEAVTGVGHHKQWKLYRGKKDSTGGQVSIFVLEKKTLKSSHREQIVKSAKKQVTTLAKIRHPGVLALIQPLSEDENYLSFVTQRIEGNLASIIRNKKFDEFVTSQLQLKLSLFPLLEAINFLHEIVKLCHLGLSFEAIYVTAEGKWKIGGMNYAQVLTGEEYQPVEGDGNFWDYLHLAPEVVNDKKFNKFSDSYSLGIMFINFMLLLKKNPHNLMQATQSREAYNQNAKSYREYTQFPAILQSVAPQQLIQVLSQLLIDQSTYRLSISSLESSKWINDPIVLTVKYLEKISNYENKQQVEFLKGLAGVIDKFSGKILYKRIIPNLTNLLKFNHLVASIIFITIDIMKKSMISVEDWRKTVWPELKNITQGKQMTAQSLYLLISNMEVLEKFVTEQSFMSSIIPLYLKCFDCPPKLKLLALRHVERLTKKYDYQFTKTKIVPKLVVSMKDEKIEVRKDTLKALYGIITRLDPHTIVNVVLGGLQNCRKAGADPFINAITVQLYNKITTNMSAQVLASKIMPGLMPYLIDPSIEREEFGLYKNALLNMMNKIQDERKKTWNQHSGSGVGIGEKFSEKDFVLEKLEVDSGSGSSTNLNLGNDARFEFLNEYKIVSSSPNIVINNQQQSRPTEQTTFMNPLPQQQQNTFQYQQPQSTTHPTGSSFGFELPKQSPVQTKLTTTIQRQQNQPIEITFTDNGFGSEFKSSFNMSGFGGDSTPKIEMNYGITQSQVASKQVNNQWNYQPPKYQSQAIQNDGNWNINSFGNNHNHNNNTFSLNTNASQKAPQYKPVELDFGAFNHLQNKQKPFSPSTQPQINQIQSKPQMKGPADSSPTKKLVGPNQGGLKKPPKYNQFNMPPSQQQKTTIPSYPTSFDSGFSSTVTPSVQNSFDTNSFFNNQQPKPNISKPIPTNFGLSTTNNDDPFAEVQNQFNFSTNMNNQPTINPPTINQGFNFNTSMNLNSLNSQTNNSKSSDPFDDLL